MRRRITPCDGDANRDCLALWPLLFVDGDHGSQAQELVSGPRCRWHEQRRRASAVEKQRVAAFQAVAKQPLECIERNALLRDRKIRAPAAHAHAVAHFRRRTGMRNPRMQFAVDHQHRPGLGGERRLGLPLEKRARFKNSGLAFSGIKDPIGLQVEIAGARTPGWRGPAPGRPQHRAQRAGNPDGTCRH